MAGWLVRSEKHVERRPCALENYTALPGRNELSGMLEAEFPLKSFWARVLMV
jgi:hypothetical protein